MSVFRRLYAAFWGPRTDDVMRAACLTLLHTPGVATLADIPKLLTDPAYRARATTAVTDPVLRGFWAWYDDLSDPAKAQAVAPLLNKLRAFLLRPFARAALAGGPADLDLATVLDHGGICLVRIPKGSLGEDTTRLIGSLVVAAVWQAATARARQPQPDRADASLVIDECHNFLHLPYPIEDMLAEARGFRLSMTLAHQHLGQLSRDLREGIATNARSKIFFTAGPDDARDLARHTQPRLTEHDLAHLDAFHAAARLVNHGAHTPAFTLQTQPLPPPMPGQARALRAAAARNTRSRRAAGAGGPDLAKPPAADDHRHQPAAAVGHARPRPPPIRGADPPDRGTALISDPARQHTLRHPRPRYDAPRAANTTDHQAALAGRLTARDRWILHMLHEHRVLTTHHLTALAFPSPRAARLRLRELYLWSVLDRFQPHTPTGSAPAHYVLGPAGAAVLAAEHGIDPNHFGYRRDRTNAIAHSLRLAHTLGVNTWFTTLTTTDGASARAVRPSRERPAVRLTVWWSEARCARHFGDLTRPDAYGRLTTTPHTATAPAPRGGGGREFEFFLEYDTGTEPLTRLARKLPGYAALADATGITTPLLIWLPTARREAAARPASPASSPLPAPPSGAGGDRRS